MLTGEKPEPTDSAIDNGPQSLLMKLQGEASASDLQRDVILVAESDRAVANIVVRTVNRVFPRYKVEVVRNEQEAIEAISDRLLLSVAFVLSTDSSRDYDKEVILGRDDNGGHTAIPDIPEIDFSLIPIVTTPGEDEERREATFRLRDEARIDGILTKPFQARGLEEVMISSTQRRMGIVEEVETDSREAVLGDFIPRYVDYCRLWTTALKQCSFYNPNGQCDTSDTSDSSPEALADGLIEYIDRASLLFAGLSNLFDRGLLSDEELRHVIHDLNNVLSILLYNPEFIMEHELSAADEKIIKIFADEVKQMNAYVRGVRLAYSKGGSWARLRRAPLAPQNEQKLVFPKANPRVCVIDDDEGIQRLAKRLIEDESIGGKAFTANGMSTLFTADSEAGDEGVDYVLLDNDLGEEGHGHELIEAIRTLWPNALIIGHTSNADELNADPENPYAKAGIELADKRAWKEVSGIARRKGPQRSE